MIGRKAGRPAGAFSADGVAVVKASMADPTANASRNAIVADLLARKARVDAALKADRDLPGFDYAMAA